MCPPPGFSKNYLTKIKRLLYNSAVFSGICGERAVERGRDIPERVNLFCVRGIFFCEIVSGFFYLSADWICPLFAFCTVFPAVDIK
jgi:hypothetical protein